MNPFIQLRKVTRFIIPLFVFACLAVSSAALAVSPPPDGDYPGGNTAEGLNALFSLSTQDGGFNTAVGWYSLTYNVNGSFNTAVGAGALDLNTGHNNTAVGAAALLLNTNATGNTAVGTAALALSNGDGNTAVGAAALSSNVTGAGNTAVGAQALLSNTGTLNTAVGLNALTANTIGTGNTAIGAGPGQVGSNFVPAALGSNTTGRNNTAFGGAGPDGSFGALGSNTEGSRNTAIGQSALPLNTTGSDNIAVGTGAGQNLTTGDDNIDIGNAGVTDEANTIRIGNSQTATFIAGINAASVTGTAVQVNADGQLGTVPSSVRFKKDIKTMGKTSETILSLEPVSFHYKSDSKQTPQFGLIAEDVAKVNPNLVVRDRKGEIYSVRYDAVNAMLLNEFLKEHKKVEQQQAEISQLQSTVAKQESNAVGQQKQIEALTAGLQKVSAQLQVSKAAPQTVLNNQ